MMVVRVAVIMTCQVINKDDSVTDNDLNEIMFSVLIDEILFLFTL